MQRRLTTIVAADVAGYSRLIGLDEEGTLAALQGHREALIDPLLEQYDGRVANTAGDSLLIEFPSAVEAVRCAMAVQEGMVERNAEVPEDQRIDFRIGINVGDVVDQDGDLLGDGVNIAARLEAQAPPGGIVLSRSVRDQVRDRMELDLADLGEVEVKNIARPVRAFQVMGDVDTAVVAGASPKRRWVKSVTVAVAGLVLLVCFAWWQWLVPEFEPADPAKMAYALPDKPSIAVLAFDNLSGDPKQEYLSNGLTEDITAALARNPRLFVIARNSSFAYKGKAVDIKKIAEDLGVQYIVQGSLQQSEDNVRITAQLIDAVNGSHIWAKKFDREFESFFNIRDDITLAIAASLYNKLNIKPNSRDEWKWTRHEGRSLEGWLLSMEADEGWDLRTVDGLKRALELGKKAVELDPNSPAAHDSLGWYWIGSIRAKLVDRTSGLEKAISQAHKALELDPNFAGSYGLLSRAYVMNRRYEDAVRAATKGVELARGDAIIVALAGLAHREAMELNDAETLLRESMRLDPLCNAWVPHCLSGKFLNLRSALA